MNACCLVLGLPEGAGACSLNATEDIPNFSYQALEYAYELRMPDPLGMSTGKYTGSITYSVGPNQDFDFGDIMIPNDTALTFNFTLDVQHTLKVEVPPAATGSNWSRKAAGRPGCNATVARNACSATRLSICQPPAASRCASNANTTMATITARCMNRFPGMRRRGHCRHLPRGISDASGNRSIQGLCARWQRTELFIPGHDVERKPGNLHFEIGREAVK